MTRKLATMFLLMPFAAMATTWYVNGSSGSDHNSGTSQSSAKATIQAAIDASTAGDTILVAPGTYAPINSSGKAISIRSTGGAGVTIIDGGRSQRCATLQADGCAENERWETEVTGFTFQHGYENYGRDSHAGARGGTLKNCIFRYNESHGYGNSCGVGGAKAYNCLFYGNTSSYSGIWGGGVAGWSEIYNCTIVDNDAYGVWDCTEYNTIVWGNTGDVYISYGHSELTPQYSCFSSASYVGAGCVTFAPQFVDAANGDYRLAAGSPCIDAGDNSYVTGDKDLAGNARIANGTVDIGCYEYGGASAHRYEVVLSSGITWTDARNAAIARGGHLATITSAAEWAELESQCELDNFLWLGGTDKDSEGNWTWVTGEAWSYSRWSATQPDNYNSQHYLLQLRGDWDDEADSAYAYTMAGYVVEYGDGLSDTLTGASPTPPPVLNDGLVAYWPFDGNSNDASGNGNHGTTHGVTLTADRFGNANGACYFGQGNYISVSDSSSLDSVSEELTIATWIRIDEWVREGWASIINKSDGDYARYYAFNLGNGNALPFNGFGTIEISSEVSGQSNTMPRLGEWEHVAVTYGKDHVLYAYLNGVCVGTYQNSASSFSPNTAELHIGRDRVGGDDYLAGALDDLRIYNRALSAAEVKALYDGTPVTPPPTPVEVALTPSSFGGDANWYQESAGVWHSGDISNSQSTYMEATVSDATQVSFRWKVSSESGYDYLRFYIDGNEQNSISGEQGWAQKTYTLSSGTHTLKWVYSKDGSVSNGSDCGWVEEIRATRAYTGPICTVTFDANGGSGGDVCTYYYGDNLGSLPTPTREGYEFLGWFTAKTDGSQADCWTEVYDNAIYYAQWRILSYTVMFDANGGSVGTSSVTRNHGASLGSLPVPSRTGHTFLGWYTSASGGSRVYETDAVTSSRTLYARWQANTYTVTFNANGGDSSCSYSRTYGSSVGTLPTASRSGYVFKGWFTAASGGTQVSSSASVTGNATYYAHWATYAEEIAAALGTANVEFSTDTLAPWVPDGSSVCSGYVYHNGSSTMSVRLYGSGLLSFRWKVSSEPEYDTLTYSVDGIQGGRISGEQGWSSASILVAGAGWHTVRFTYAKDGGSTYGSDCGWVDSLAWTGSAPPVTNFTITFNANGGTVGTASVTRSQGAQLGTLPIPARTGYTFLGWFTSASGGVQVYASTTVSANATYYAHWQANGSGGDSGGGTTPPVVNYTVTFDGNGGSVDTLRVTRASGAAIGSMPVPEAEGYEFLGWFTARTGGVQVSTTDRVTANATYYAHWRAVEDPNTLWDEDEAFDADAAAVFDGFLTKNDEACGVLQVKVGKANKRTGVAKLTAKVSLLGQPSKLSYKGVFGTPGAGDDFTPGVATLTCNGHPDLALRIGRNALWGELDDYEVEGARNVFAKAGDPLAAALLRWQGAYTLVLETVEAEGAGAANAWGYSGLTLTVGAKGKVKIQGTMVDGAKVNVASQLLVGENRCCIPVVAPLYAKKGGFGFNLWLQDDGSLEVGELGAWDATDSKTPFSAWFGENIPAARAGAALPASLSFMFLGEPDIDGVEVLYDFLPWEVPVTTGSSWTLPAAGSVKYDRDVEDYIDVKESSNPAGLKLTYVSKTGAFKGSFKMYAVDDGGRLKKYTVKVSGVMVDGVGYGTASAKNAGSWPVSIQ